MVELIGGEPNEDRICFNPSDRSIKIVLGVLSVDGAMIGKVDPHCFSLQPEVAQWKHVLRLIQHTPIRKETLARLLDALRYANVAQNPIVGDRRIKVSVSPPGCIGPTIELCLHVDAVDVPTALEIPEPKVSLRWATTPRPPDVEMTPDMEERVVSMPITDVAIAKTALVVDPDTDTFAEGWCKVWIHSGFRTGDHLWVVNSDGAVLNPTDSSTLTAPSEPLEDKKGISLVPVFDVDPQPQDALDASNNVPIGRAKSIMSMVQPPVAEDRHPIAAIVFFNGKALGTLRWEQQRWTDNSMSLFDHHASGIPDLKKANVGPKKKTEKLAAMMDPNAPYTTKGLLLECVQDGTASIQGLQEFLRCIHFTTADPNPVPGVRDVRIEMVVGETSQRLDAEGNRIQTRNQNDVLRDKIAVRVTHPVIKQTKPRKNSIGEGFAPPEMAYLEKSGVKRLPLFEVVADEENGIGSGLDSGFIKAEILHGISFHDTFLAKELDDKEIYEPGASKIVVKEAPATASAMRHELNFFFGDPSLRPRQITPYCYVKPRPDDDEELLRSESTMIAPDELANSLNRKRSSSSFSGRKDSEASLSRTASGIQRSYLKELEEKQLAEQEKRKPKLREFLPIPSPFASSASEEAPVAMNESLAVGDGASIDISSSPSFKGSPQTAEKRLQRLLAIGIDGRFCSKDLIAYAYHRDGDQIATAYVIPGVIVIGWKTTLKKREVNYLLRSLAFKNMDPNPDVLLKWVRLSLNDGMSTCSVDFDLKIIPVDDPLEITLHRPLIPYRLNATEMVHYSPEILVTLTKHREAACCTHALPANESEFKTGGPVPLFPLDAIALEDPDTDFWDRGSISVDVISGGAKPEGIVLLNLEQQETQWKRMGRTPKYFLQIVEQQGSTKLLALLDGEKNVLSPNVGVFATSSKQNLPESGLLTFGKRKSEKNLFVNLDVLAYILSCFAMDFGAGTPATVTLGPRGIRLTVSDGRNPLPGKASVALDVQAPLICTKEKATVVDVKFTRTKSPQDSYPILQRILYSMADIKYLLPFGGYLELFSIEAPTGDSVGLRLNGTQLSVKDGHLLAGKEVIGSIVVHQQLLRVDISAEQAKLFSVKRLTDLLKGVVWQFVERGTRQVALALGEVRNEGSPVELSVVTCTLSVV